MYSLGAVSYLNAQPLLRGISCELIKTTPSKLLSIFESGKVDAALLSLYDILKRPQLKTVDNIAIGCRGPVYSVILAYEGSLEKIKKIRLDPASHTSNELIKIIFKKFYQLDPEFVEEGNSNDLKLLPRLIIGDPAIAFREGSTTCSILDLGEEWYRFTGLPFVFARWCLKKDHPHQQEIIRMLQQAKECGLREREKIAASCSDPVFALLYFTEYIRYDCGAEEERGIELFRSFL
ncbi:MAG: menaquinone biosynthesis protein [Chthoniobacterales bacterium]|nr:menaquinone biosynthesis protein [Chthoniobacterales bacterium]